MVYHNNKITFTIDKNTNLALSLLIFSGITLNDSEYDSEAEEANNGADKR